MLFLLTALREGQPYADVDEEDDSETKKSKKREISSKSEKQLDFAEMKKEGEKDAAES